MLGHFLIIFGCFLGSGARGVSGPEKSAKNGLDFVWNLARFWTVLALFGVLWRVFLFACFQERPFCAFLAILWPRGSQKGGF